MNRNKDNRTIVIGVVGFVALICVIVVAYVVIGAIKKHNDLAMFNKNEYTKEYTDKDLVRIENAVWTALGTNYGYSDSEIKQMKITMRKSELKIFDKDKRELDFLIDISNINLTYSGALVSSQDDDEVYLWCPELEDMLDKNVFCIDNNGSSSVGIILGEHLPYTGLVDNKVVATISVDPNDSEASLRTDVSTCNVPSVPADSTIRDFVKDWIRSVTDVDANIFPISIYYYDCEGKINNNDD